jgi:hypothetical protein
MENRNFQIQNDNNENKKTTNTFWRNFGLIFLALGLAVLTVVVISL